MPDQLNTIVQRMIDAGESEDNIATVIQHFTASPPPVERGGLTSPLTSVIAPELEAVRGKLNAATEVPAGRPFMARSRTGALYPSETGTGAVNAAKSVARGAGGEVINQAEGMTSPLGIGGGVVSGALRFAPRQVGAVLGAAGRGAEAVSESPPAQYAAVAGAYHAATTGNMQKAALSVSAPYALKKVGQGLQAAGNYLRPVAAEAAAEAPAAVGAVESAAPAVSGLSAAERAGLASRYRMTPEQITRLEAEGKLGGGATTSGTLRMAPPQAPTTQPITVNEASLPASWRDLPHELDPQRVTVGAEKTGRAAGMTTQEVRDVATPILGAEPGAASPILPEGALKKIIDTLKELPKGGPEREAYVARATSGKAQWQIENIRRTLEHLGLIVPVAATGLTMREELVKRLMQ